MKVSGGKAEPYLQQLWHDRKYFRVTDIDGVIPVGFLFVPDIPQVQDRRQQRENPRKRIHFHSVFQKVNEEANFTPKDHVPLYLILLIFNPKHPLCLMSKRFSFSQVANLHPYSFLENSLTHQTHSYKIIAHVVKKYKSSSNFDIQIKYLSFNCIKEGVQGSMAMQVISPSPLEHVFLSPFWI